MIYNRFIKRFLSIILSAVCLICLSWLFLIISVMIKVSAPGPVFFKQKRVGIHKTYFEIYKFRTMRVDTPHDIPTHLLENPDRYITKIGNAPLGQAMHIGFYQSNAVSLIKMKDCKKHGFYNFDRFSFSTEYSFKCRYVDHKIM